jgi:hypothetical protein
MAARHPNINTISVVFPVFLVLVSLFCSGCPGPKKEKGTSLKIPRGYVDRLDIQLKDRVLGFGPFVGYYFKPENPEDLTRLSFVCFNEDRFYTRDLPENTLLFEGDAVLTQLTDTGFDVPTQNRINPVFFEEAPRKWVNDRPRPRDEYLHFHSCYDGLGPVLAGYWIRHQGNASFTYDMGGRMGPDSPLYHKVRPGIDKQFAKIMEFDAGPDSRHGSKD